MCSQHLKRISYIVIVTILTILTISSCAPRKAQMYKGNEVESSKQAVVRVNVQEKSKDTITILQVDGEKAGGFFTPGRGASEVYVLPGKHEIVARLNRGLTYGFGSLWLVAEPGETYIVKARIEGYGVKMWLENARTGQTVGGEIGCDNEPKSK